MKWLDNYIVNVLHDDELATRKHQLEAITVNDRATLGSLLVRTAETFNLGDDAN